jgi:YidC/Oxa1 family membrane protein insertase
MFGFFTLQVPAGLTLYWVTSNTLQMLQQWLTTSGRLNLGGQKPALATAGASNATTTLIDKADSTTDVSPKSEQGSALPKRRRKRKK